MNHHIEMIPTNLTGLNTGRPRYKVVCHTCNTIVHKATTGPLSIVRNHIENPGTGYEQPTSPPLGPQFNKLPIGSTGDEICSPARRYVWNNNQWKDVLGPIKEKEHLQPGTRVTPWWKWTRTASGFVDSKKQTQAFMAWRERNE